MRPLIAQRVATPPSLEEQLGGALTIECFRIGNTAAVVTRENIANADESPNYRWHLSLAHPERRPSQAEFEIAMTLIPDNLHYAIAVPHSGYPPKDPTAIDVWEVHDQTLTERWEFDSVVARQP